MPRLTRTSTARQTPPSGHPRAIDAWRLLNEPGPQVENFEGHASHIGMGMNPLALYAVADRLAQPTGASKLFDPTGAQRWFFQTGVNPDPANPAASA